MFVDIAGPARIYIRDAGAGSALIFLHGGWGYEVYPFDRQIEALSGHYRILIPDRSGYGRSPGITRLPPDFHRRAATETMQVMDALEIGHRSDPNTEEGRIRARPRARGPWLGWPP